MKKFLTTVLIAALLVSSAGCQAKQPQTSQSEPNLAPQTLVIDETSTTENSVERIDTRTVLEQITAGLEVKLDATEKKKDERMTPMQTPETVSEKSTPAPEQEKVQKPSNGGEKEKKQVPSPTAPPAKVDATPVPEKPDTGYLIVKVKATPTPPAATPAPTPAPTPEPPTPTPEPAAPTPEPVIEEPTFDIGYWIGYAQSCAQGLGLRLESSAVDCWDNPIGAGPHSTCLERDISSRLNRYANDPDITDVWIWYESAGGSSYNIYIGYA